MYSRRNAVRGFTLIEVLLVLVIIVGIAAIAAVSLFGGQEEANINMTKTKMQKIRKGLDGYKVTYNKYPEEGDLTPLIRVPDEMDEADQRKWSGPYTVETEEDLKDAWGNEIQYALVDSTATGRERKIPQLTSPGPDGVEDTDDDIRVPEQIEE